MKSRFVLIPLLVGICWHASSAQAPSAQQVLDQVRSRFEETGVFSARFQQTIDDSFGDSQVRVLSGSIVAGRAGYRVEMPDQVVVTDEVTTWVYIVADRQVIINTYVEDDGSFSPNQFIGEGAEEFAATFSDKTAPDRYVVELTPKSPESYIGTATLWVRKSDFVVTQIDVVDVNGASIRFQMSDIDFHPSVSKETFHFVIPDGAEVIDLRS